MTFVQNALMQKRQLQFSVTDVSCIEKVLLKQCNIMIIVLDILERRILLGQ
mgnify:CR=1 FL=1